MKIAHTSGPWFLDKHPDQDKFNVFASGFNTAMFQVSCIENSTRRVSGDEVFANAHLIAAAPDLLAVLLEIEQQNSFVNHPIMAKVQAAINKATRSSK